MLCKEHNEKGSWKKCLQLRWTAFLVIKILFLCTTMMEQLMSQILPSFKCSVDFHLAKYLHKLYSFIRDVQFAPSREELAAARKLLKSPGMRKNTCCRCIRADGCTKAVECEGSVRDQSPQQLL